MEAKHQELLARIASNHQIIMNKDDPVIALLTLFEFAIEHSETRQQSQQKQFEQYMEAALSRVDQAMLDKLKHWESSATAKSSRIIDVALEETQKQNNEEKQRFFTELENRLASQQAINTAAADKIQFAALVNLVTVVLAGGVLVTAFII